jgi:hypothetical protein
MRRFDYKEIQRIAENKLNAQKKKCNEDVVNNKIIKFKQILDKFILLIYNVINNINKR